MTYPRANTTAQWFYDTFKNSRFANGVEKVVWHTTEGTGWPPYDGGAKAPHYTVRPNFTTKKMEWRQHFPDGVFSRALRNESGGVQTNLDGALQVEIVGTCDPSVRWRGLYLKSWAMEDWMIQGLADFVRWVEEEYEVPRRTVRFKKYPDSAGDNNGVRMSGATWNAFRGHCGHQHVPENVHGDPGPFPMEEIFDEAAPITTDSTKDDDMKLTDKIELSDAAVRNLNAAGNTFKEGDEVTVAYLALWGDARSQQTFRMVGELLTEQKKTNALLDQLVKNTTPHA